MDRRMLWIGIIIFIAGLGIAYLSFPSPYISANNGKQYDIMLLADSGMYAPLQMNGTGAMSVSFISSSPIDFYLLNGSAFSMAGRYVQNPGNFSASVNEIKGKGIIYSEMNSTSSSTLNSTNSSAGYGQVDWLVYNGTYYLVFENPSNVSTALSYYVVIQDFGIGPGPEVSTGGSVFAVLLVIAGVAIAAYGIFRRRTDTGEFEGLGKIYRGIKDDLKQEKTSAHKSRKKKR